MPTYTCGANDILLCPITPIVSSVSLQSPSTIAKKFYNGCDILLNPNMYKQIMNRITLNKKYKKLIFKCLLLFRSKCFNCFII